MTLKLEFNFDLKALYNYLKNTGWVRKVEYERLWPIKYYRFYEKGNYFLSILVNKENIDFNDKMLEVLHTLEKVEKRFYLTILYDILCCSKSKELEDIKKKILTFILITSRD